MKRCPKKTLPIQSQYPRSLNFNYKIPNEKTVIPKNPKRKTPLRNFIDTNTLFLSYPQILYFPSQPLQTLHSLFCPSPLLALLRFLSPFVFIFPIFSLLPYPPIFKFYFSIFLSQNTLINPNFIVCSICTWTCPYTRQVQF